MLFRVAIRLGASCACLALFACTLNNNTAVPATPNIPAPVVATTNVAANDVGDSLPCAKNWDIGSVQAQRIGPPGATYTELVVTTTFEKETPNDGVPDNSAFGSLLGPGGSRNGCDGKLMGEVLVQTGTPGTNSQSCGVAGFFTDATYWIEYGFIGGPVPADGNAVIYNNDAGDAADITGEATISGGGNVVNVTIPISAIGGSSSGPFNIGVGWGNGVELTDCVPTTGYMADAVSRRVLNELIGGATIDQFGILGGRS